MKSGEALRDRILNLCEERKITVNKLSTVCGMTQSTLNNIVNGSSKDPKISTVKKYVTGWK